MKISFELSPRDMRYFRERLRLVREGKSARAEDIVIRLAAELVGEAVAAEPPEFVRVRLLKLEQLIEMLCDDEWRLQGRDRARILDALAYFVDPDDLIPDRVPGVGYLDDAIMIELVAQEFRHEIDGYREFRRYRESARQCHSGPEREPLLQKPLVEKRRQIRARIQAKRDRAADQPTSGRRFKLW